MGKHVLRTKLCEMFGIEYPIILAGMGDVIKDTCVSTGELCAAVSNAGGIGFIGAGSMSTKALRQHISDAKRLSSKPFGVDIPFPAGTGDERTMAEIEAGLPTEQVKFADSLFEKLGLPREKSPSGKIMDAAFSKELWRVTVDEGIKFVAIALGTPDWLIPEAHSLGIKVACLIGTVKQARRLAAMGADLIIAQGHESGGHCSRVGLMSLLPQVVEAVSPTPVVAAGGIASGRQIAAALVLEAIGVWCGSVFEASYESPLTAEAKQAIVEGNEESFRITRVLTGKTCRV